MALCLLLAPLNHIICAHTANMQKNRMYKALVNPVAVLVMYELHKPPCLFTLCGQCLWFDCHPMLSL